MKKNNDDINNETKLPRGLDSFYLYGGLEAFKTNKCQEETNDEDTMLENYTFPLVMTSVYTMLQVE